MKEHRRRPGRGMPFRNTSGSAKGGTAKATLRAAIVSDRRRVGSSVAPLPIRSCSRGLSAHDEPSRAEEMLARAMRRWATPQAMRTATKPSAADREVIDEALEHFADHCATCHANNGSGDTEIGRAFIRERQTCARRTRSR